MSCPDARALMRYADRELAGGALHVLEGHLIACRACRTKVVALQSESLLLSDVLQERARRVVLHPAPAPPEPSIAMGLPLAIAGVTAVAAVSGLLFESRLPGGFDLLNPLRLVGVTRMVFDLIFLLRDRAPGLVELGIAVAGVASVSALLTFAVGSLYRRVFGATALLALCLLAPERSSGFELRHVHAGAVTVGADERVEQTLVVSAETLQLEGVVDGDLMVVAERVRITGTVRGNLYAFARRLELDGTVTGGVIGAIENAEIDGSVEGSVYATCDHLDLGPSGRVGRDLGLFVNDAELEGHIGRDVFFGGERLEVRGQVGRDLEARWGAERVSLLDGARIQGNVDAWLDQPDRLERARGAVVAGEVRTHPRASARAHYLAAYLEPWFWALHGAAFVASFLFGLLVYALVPDLLGFELTTARQLFGALGQGFVALVVTPIALALLALTVVGIPVALLGIVTWLAALYTAEIVVATAVGRWLLPPRDASLLSFGRTLVAGLAVVVVAEHIPFVGVPIFVLVLLVGLGSLAARALAALSPHGAAGELGP